MDERIPTAPTVTLKSTQKLITDFARPIAKSTKSALGNITKCASLPNLSENPDNSEKKFNHLFIKKNDRGYNFCNNATCRYCPLMNKTGTITCSYTKQEYSSMKNVSCRSSNLIYCITCKICKKQYVGQTSRRIQDRFQGHFGDIMRNANKKSIPFHFNSKNHRGIKDIEITVLEYIKNTKKHTGHQNRTQERITLDAHSPYIISK